MNYIAVLWLGLFPPLTATPVSDGARLVGYGCNGQTLFAIEEDEFPRCERIEAYPIRNVA